jgi:protocatechuate 3,4-dioxygenase beta subunit
MLYGERNSVALAGDSQMRSIVCAAVLLSLLSGIQPSSAWAQDPKETGTITGRVTLDGKPARDITVIGTPSITDSAKIVDSILNKPASLKATTDSDGRYKFEDVTAGKYKLVPFAPTLVGPSLESGSDVTVTGGSSTEGIDFSLSLGGVITGKVTDSDGRPVIGERIALKPADSSPSAASSIASMMSAIGGSGRMYATDDRGIYRIFGLRPGRYLVSAGSDRDVLSAMFKFRPKRTQTFYPGVTDEAKAKQVQVTAGSEATGVDIQFSLSDKGFGVTGRVVEAEKGTPIANAMVAYSKARRVPNNADDEEADKDNEEWISGLAGGLPGGIATTNDRGEFRFESVAPGSYKLEVSQLGALTGTGSSEFYGDPVNFEVRSANVDKIDVKVHRGASISGVAVAENADGQSGLQSFGRLMLTASVIDTQTKSNSSGTCAVEADGTFRIGGLKPGKATIRLFSMGEQEAAILRIERNGVEIQGGVDIQANEQVTGLRVVLTSANCVIRGHVTIEGGPLPPGETLTVRARRVSGDATGSFDSDSDEVDSKGDFEIEDLAPVTYEVEVSATLPAREGMRSVSAKQTVTASSAGPVFVTLVLDLRGKGSDK